MDAHVLLDQEPMGLLATPRMFARIDGAAAKLLHPDLVLTYRMALCDLAAQVRGRLLATVTGDRGNRRGNQPPDQLGPARTPWTTGTT